MLTLKKVPFKLQCPCIVEKESGHGNHWLRENPETDAHRHLHHLNQVRQVIKCTFWFVINFKNCQWKRLSRCHFTCTIVIYFGQFTDRHER